MSTVKYYKDLGLEFVDGDLGDSNGLELDDMHENQGGDKFIWAFGEDTVTEFAWRNNTGKAPSYRGDIEVELSSGGVLSINGVIAVHGFWVLQSVNPILKWRPMLIGNKGVKGYPTAKSLKQITEDGVNSLNSMSKVGVAFTDQQKAAIKASAGQAFVNGKIEGKAKPVFTQEMRDSGELPPIGSEVVVCGIADIDWRFPEMKEGDKLKCIAHTSENGYNDIIGVYQRCGMAVSIMGDYVKPIDTRTDEQKLIDEACRTILDGGFLLPVGWERVVEGMIKSGYRKPDRAKGGEIKPSKPYNVNER